MKPIFETERVFLSKHLNRDVPPHCWKSHTKIYLDPTKEKPIYVFQVKEGIIKLKKEVEFDITEQKCIPELIEMYSERLDKLESESVEFLKGYIEKFKDEKFIISHSSGKDSVVSDAIWRKAIENIGFEFNWTYSFANTSNETPDTYKFIKDNLPKDKTNTLNPKVGFYQWIKNNGYFIPSVVVRNCCSTYKEGQLINFYDRKERLHMVLGVRKSESTKRANYTWIMDSAFRLSLFNKDNIPKLWTNVAPIIDWDDIDIWLYILKNKLSFNKQYEYGFARVGCLLCPYSPDYTDLLIKEYYPTYWVRWMGILEKNYDITGVAKRLKMSLQEWQDGKWKQAIGKEAEILKRKKTDKTVKELADLKGVSIELADKYFDRICVECGAKVKPGEVAMNLKMNGRGMDVSKMKCKKCFCKERGINRKDWVAMMKEFINEGCALF